jgi:hypothetical protein
MNAKTIGGIVAALVIVVGGYLAYRYTQLQAAAAKWSGPIKEIAEESITKEGDVSKIHFVSMVEAPIDKVQTAMWGVEKGQETVENIRLSKLLKDEGKRKEVQIQVQLLSLPLQEFIMEFLLDEAQHRMTFKTLQASTTELAGTYQLEGSPDGKLTRVTYDATAKPRVPIPVPQSVQDSAQREFFVNTVRGIKKRATGS